MYDGRIVKLSLDTVRFPDGSTGVLEMIRHRGAAAVLPFLGSLEEPDPGVLLIRQYRYAAGGFIYEVPAGIPDEGDEGWEACARRELEEETGYRSGRVRRLGEFFTSPGFADERMWAFVAEDLEFVGQRLEPGEQIEVQIVEWAGVGAMIRDGRIRDGKTIAGLLMWQQQRRDGTA